MEELQSRLQHELQNKPRQTEQDRQAQEHQLDILQAKIQYAEDDKRMLESEIDNKYGCLFNEDTDLGHCIQLLPKYNECLYHWIKANDKNPTPTKSPDQHTACVSESQGQSSSLSSTSNDIVLDGAEVLLRNLDKINQEVLAVLEKHWRPDDDPSIVDQIVFIDDNNSALRLYIWDKIFEDYRTQDDSKPGCPRVSCSATKSKNLVLASCFWIRK
jgi:hypothetical protein